MQRACRLGNRLLLFRQLTQLTVIVHSWVNLCSWVHFICHSFHYIQWSQQSWAKTFTCLWTHCQFKAIMRITCIDWFDLNRLVLLHTLVENDYKNPIIILRNDLRLIWKRGCVMVLSLTPETHESLSIFSLVAFSLQMPLDFFVEDWDWIFTLVAFYYLVCSLCCWCFFLCLPACLYVVWVCLSLYLHLCLVTCSLISLGLLCSFFLDPLLQFVLALVCVFSLILHCLLLKSATFFLYP